MLMRLKDFFNQIVPTKWHMIEAGGHYSAQQFLLSFNSNNASHSLMDEDYEVNWMNENSVVVLSRYPHIDHEAVKCVFFKSCTIKETPLPNPDTDPAEYAFLNARIYEAVCMLTDSDCQDVKAFCLSKILPHHLQMLNKKQDIQFQEIFVNAWTRAYVDASIKRMKRLAL